MGEKYLRGEAISSATARHFKPPVPLTAKEDAAAKAAAKKPIAPEEPRVIFTLRVFAQAAQNRNVECNQIRHAAAIALQELGAGVGHKLSGEIRVGSPGEEPTIVGHFSYEPSSPLT
jgi:hypothetical protein